MRLSTLAPIIAAITILCGGTSISQAQKKGALQKAKRLFEQGETQYRLGNFTRALGSYQAALRQAQRPSIIFNIAQCYRQLKRWDKSLFYYKLYLSDWERQHPGEPPPYYSEVRSRIKRMERLLARERKRSEGKGNKPEDWGALTGLLRLDGLPAGARIYVNGALRGRTPMEHPMELAAGQHRVTVEHATAAPWGRTVTIKSGDLTRIPVQLEVPRQQRNKVWLGLGIASAVVALGAEVTALVFTVRANDTFTNDPDYETNRGAAIAGHVGAGVFVAVSVVSFVAYALSGDEKKKPPATVGFAPVRDGGLVLGSFEF